MHTITSVTIVMMRLVSTHRSGTSSVAAGVTRTDGSEEPASTQHRTQEKGKKASGSLPRDGAGSSQFS